jgi:hypothetical protein
MSEKPIASIEACFSDMYDPPVQGRCDYPLIEIITIAICATLAGAEGWTDMETFAKSKELIYLGGMQIYHGWKVKRTSQYQIWKRLNPYSMFSKSENIVLTNEPARIIAYDFLFKR